jgi:hypothetical protein
VPIIDEKNTTNREIVKPNVIELRNCPSSAIAAYHFVVNPDQGSDCTSESLSENIAIMKSGAYKKRYTPLNAAHEKNPLSVRSGALRKRFLSVMLLKLELFLIKSALCSCDSGENSQ